jgi:hypothetical protein
MTDTLTHSTRVYLDFSSSGPSGSSETEERQYGGPNGGFERYPGQGRRPVYERRDERFSSFEPKA